MTFSTEGADSIVVERGITRRVAGGFATSVAFAVNPSMYKSLPYDSERDFTPITNYANGLGYILVAHPSVQANNIKELIEVAKKQTLRYSSAGIGNGQHLAGELLAQKAGIDKAALERTVADYNRAAHHKHQRRIP